MPTDEGAPDRRLCVVVDTNVWRKTQMLTNSVSASFLYALDRLNGRIGMPEVVEREIIKHGLLLGREARDAIQKHLSTIRALTGSSPAVDIPSDDDLRSSLATRIATLENRFERVPFDRKLGIRGLDRVDQKRPPSHKKQQFKDSVIWETCLDFAKSFSVYLITEDTAFFQDSKPANGLDRQLRAELESLQVSVELRPNLESLLSEVVDDVAGTLEVRPASDILVAYVEPTVRDSIERDGLILQNHIESKFEAFVTEVPGRLALSFRIVFSASSPDATSEPIRVEAHGDCFYRPIETVIHMVRIDKIVRYGTTETEPPRTHVFLHAETVLSGKQPDELHTIHAPLPGGGEYVVIQDRPVSNVEGSL